MKCLKKKSENITKPWRMFSHHLQDYIIIINNYSSWGIKPLRRWLRLAPSPVRTSVTGSTSLRTVTVYGERGCHPPPGNGRYLYLYLYLYGWPLENSAKHKNVFPTVPLQKDPYRTILQLMKKIIVLMI